MPIKNKCNWAAILDIKMADLNKFKKWFQWIPKPIIHKDNRCRSTGGGGCNYTIRWWWRWMCVCMGTLYHSIVACAHLGNGSGHRTARLAAPLILTNSLVRYETMLHSCGTSPVRGYRLVTVCTHSDFIVLPHWDTRPPASRLTIPLSHIILAPSQLVLALS